MRGLNAAPAIFAALTLLAGCDPFAESRTSAAEQKRIACLDQYCEGDQPPPRNPLTESAVKLNGKWYLGPSAYYNNVDGRAGFEWWNHRPISSADQRPPELQQHAAAGRGYDYSIEIFLTGRQRWPETAYARPWERSIWDRRLQQLQADGHSIERQTLRKGLDLVRIRKPDGSPYGYDYYVATDRPRIRGQGHPVLSCQISTPPHPWDSCSSGEYWQDDVFAEFRFRIHHAKDWPEIHTEIVRVLNLLKKA